MRNTVAEALEDITALFYDEERNEIYTGNKNGLVHVWSNWDLIFLFVFISFSEVCFDIDQTDDLMMMKGGSYCQALMQILW